MIDNLNNDRYNKSMYITIVQQVITNCKFISTYHYKSNIFFQKLSINQLIVRYKDKLLSAESKAYT